MRRALSALHHPFTQDTSLQLWQQSSDALHETPTLTPLQDLLRSALDKYHLSINVSLAHTEDPIVRSLESCTTVDEILVALGNTSQSVMKKRQGSARSQRLREVLKPLVHGLGVILDASAETASSVVCLHLEMCLYFCLMSSGRSWRQGFVRGSRSASESE